MTVAPESVSATSCATADAPGDQLVLTIRAGGQLALLSRFWTTSGNQTLNDVQVVTDVSQRTTFRLAVRSSAGFIDKLGSALGYDETDHLGWLLTESATPRYPSNPYVRLTRDRQPLDDGETGTSLESSLADRIAASGGDLQPNDVLKHLAVADVDGDVLDVRCSRWM